jgi:hypothetical protein
MIRHVTASGFSHVIRYGRGSALGLVVVAVLLDAASHCTGRTAVGARSASPARLRSVGRPQWDLQGLKSRSDSGLLVARERRERNQTNVKYCPDRCKRVPSDLGGLPSAGFRGRIALMAS